MKKHDEGYILAYVTVVLMIFCLVATVILTGALRNFQIQQNSIAQMKDQYAAEGMIEQVVAQLDAKGSPTISGYEELAEDNQTIIKKMSVSVENIEGKSVLLLRAQNGSVVVTGSFVLSAENAYSSNNVAYITGLNSYTYDSYEVGGVSE